MSAEKLENILIAVVLIAGLVGLVPEGSLRGSHAPLPLIVEVPAKLSDEGRTLAVNNGIS